MTAAADSASSGPGSSDPARASVDMAESGVIAGDLAVPVTDGVGGAPPAGPAPGAPLDWLVVALITVLTAWAAVIGMAYLPLYIGSIPFPISALVGVAAMILAPRACYRLTGSMIAALLPVVAWFGVSVYLVLARNSLMGGLPVTVVNGQWRVMVLLGLGSLAAAATVGLIWGDRLRDRLAAERAAAQARDDAAERAAEAELRGG